MHERMGAGLMDSISQRVAARQSLGSARLIYTLAIFASAFLMFSVQPMFTKMVLPQLGGSPGVWSVAMVFFQALLLGGYLYAHLSSKHLGVRAGVVVHMALLLVATFALPIALTSGLGRPPVEGQIPWLLGVFGLSVGLPFFAIAGNGPLLQAWFAKTGHPDAGNPYFLYAASNIGSFAALLLYPIAFETMLRLGEQTTAWSLGFGVLAILISAAGILVLRNQTAHRESAAPATPAPTMRRVGNYIWLAFLPSALLVAVTAHISTDIAAAPFLWIIPLALFLLTFVLIFRDRPLLSPGWVAMLVPILIAGTILAKILEFNIFATATIHLTFFFAAALMCHHRLYALRPDPAHLTHFYLWMSAGGVLGGIFAGLLSPMIFDRILEYPLLASLVMTAHPALAKVTRGDLTRQAGPIVLAGLINVALLLAFGDAADVKNGFLPFLGMAIGSASIIIFLRKPLIQAALIPVVFLFSEAAIATVFNIHHERSFFGVHEVSIRESGQFRVLTHGVTIHGAQRITNADGTPYTGPVTPLTYYHPDGLLAETLHKLPANAAGRDVGVVGLGAGAHACNGAAGDRWTVFEIDAAVARIASDPRQFTFLSTCAPQARIVLGDARLTLADEPPATFDYLLIDAFSSDSIPVHLLTREALSVYLSRLKPDGLLAFHISNKHMELQSVVAALAKDAGLAVKTSAMVRENRTFDQATSSTAAVFARTPQALDRFTAERGWKEPDARGTALWTDDYSNIPGAIWRKYVGGKL
jgi:spermidine synthase